MELFSIACLKGNELWVIGGWCCLEQRLMYRETMCREKQKREEDVPNWISCPHWGAQCREESGMVELI